MEKKEAERKQLEAEAKKEEEARNEEERRERVRQERQLIDELHQCILIYIGLKIVRKEGREKWNQQQKRIKRMALANSEGNKKRRTNEEMVARQGYLYLCLFLTLQCAVSIIVIKLRKGSEIGIISKEAWILQLDRHN